MNGSGYVFVTGGSRGIGAATARLLRTAGRAVAINYVTGESHAKSLVAELEAAGGRAIAVQGDVGLDADVKRMFNDAEASLGPLGGLVNSAGIEGGRCAVAELEVKALERLFSVNVIGTILCCREAVRRMSTRTGGQGGAIVNISSMAATIGGRAGASDYAASKAAVDCFTVGLAKEVGGEGIRVNAVRPGMTLTDMVDTLRQDPALKASIAATIPMNRIAEADEIARPIAWLLSAEASFISGACLDASGGGFIVGKPLSG